MMRTAKLFLYGIIAGFLITSCGDGAAIDTYRGELKMEGKAFRFNDCVLDHDGNAFFVGRLDVEAGFGREGTLLHKIDSKGKIIDTWDFNIGPEGLGIDVTKENELILCGFTPTDRERTHPSDRTQAVTVQKIRPNGKVLWEKVIPSNYNSVGRDIVALDDGSMLILATIGREESKGMRLIKLSEKGDVLWSKEISNGKDLDPMELVKSTDGPIYAAGSSSAEGIFIAEIDENGRVLKTNINEVGDLDYLMSMTLTPNGIAVSGMTNGESDEGRIVFLDKNLEFSDETTVSCYGWGHSELAADDDGNVFFLARSSEDFMLMVKFNPSLKQEWKREVRGTKYFEAGGVVVSGNGHILATGSYHTHGESDWKGVYIAFDQSGNYK